MYQPGGSSIGVGMLVAESTLAERHMALVAAFPSVCGALGAGLVSELARYTGEYPEPVRPFRNEAQLFALYLLHRHALTEGGDAVTGAVHADLVALRARDQMY